jgi:hypothetical protein
MADEVAPEITVTGLLEGYVTGEAYESRLDINNSIGRCTVEVLESTLPAGASVRVDNVTKEVVVKWAAHEEVSGEREVPNGSFESGDNGTWYKGGSNNGEGWTIGSGSGYVAKDGTHSARFAGVNTAASDLLSIVVKAEPGDRIQLSGQVQQGASARGNAGAMVSLIYKDIEGRTLLRKDGNMVSSGSGGRWNPSSVDAVAPVNTTGVQIAITAFRKRENKPLWVDSLRWDHRYTLGQNDDETYSLSIKVTDSENRVAYWSGTIEEFGVFLTSTLYPFYIVEELGNSPGFTEWRDLLSPVEMDSIQATPGFVSFEPRSIRQDYNAGFEAVRTTPSLVSITVRSIRVDYNAGFEAVRTTPSLTSFNIKAHPRLEIEAYSIRTTPAFVSWS